MPRPVFSERVVAGDTPAAAPLQASPHASAAPRNAVPGACSLHQLQTGDAQVDVLVGKVRRVLNRDFTLLILGETGTGKETLARAIHHDSHRARQPFVMVNCASIPESLIEAELFGHEEGTFTGARRQAAQGSIVQANGGTLLLAEIGDMPAALQARLLRVLQERKVTPLSGQRSIAVDVALICTTHRNLREMIDRQQFREDLYHRLNGLSVRLPALRERSDLAALAQRILRSECPQDTPGVGMSVMALFRRHPWPGNIRQLANVLRVAAVMAAGTGSITEAHLPDDFLEEVRHADTPQPPKQTGTMKDAERKTIREAVAAANGNISVAARRLGICRNTIYRKLFWHQDR